MPVDQLRKHLIKAKRFEFVIKSDSNAISGITNKFGKGDKMISFILFIIYMCLPDKKALGIITIVMLSLGCIVDFSSFGLFSIIDLILLIITITVYHKHF